MADQDIINKYLPKATPTPSTPTEDITTPTVEAAPVNQPESQIINRYLPNKTAPTPTEPVTAAPTSPTPTMQPPKVTDLRSETAVAPTPTPARPPKQDQPTTMSLMDKLFKVPVKDQPEYQQRMERMADMSTIGPIPTPVNIEDKVVLAGLRAASPTLASFVSGGLAVTKAPVVRLLTQEQYFSDEDILNMS